MGTKYRYTNLKIHHSDAFSWGRAAGRVFFACLCFSAILMGTGHRWTRAFTVEDIALLLIHLHVGKNLAGLASQDSFSNLKGETAHRRQY